MIVIFWFDARIYFEAKINAPLSWFDVLCGNAYPLSNIKHKYLRSCTSRCLSLSSSSGDVSSTSNFMEIPVLISWISHPRILDKLNVERRIFLMLQSLSIKVEIINELEHNHHKTHNHQVHCVWDNLLNTWNSYSHSFQLPDIWFSVS